MIRYPQILPPKARTVVELGCGDGTLGAAFKRIQPACRYFGIDSSYENVREAARRLDRAAVEPPAVCLCESRLNLCEVAVCDEAEDQQ